MKLKASILASSILLSSYAMASSHSEEASVQCSNDEGFSAKLVFEKDSNLASLTYGPADQVETVDGLTTAFYSGVGAAVKGSEVLFVVTPAFPKKLGELVVEGKTYLLQCD